MKKLRKRVVRRDLLGIAVNPATSQQSFTYTRAVWRVYRGNADSVDAPVIEYGKPLYMKDADAITRLAISLAAPLLKVIEIALSNKKYL